MKCVNLNLRTDEACAQVPHRQKGKVLKNEKNLWVNARRGTSLRRRVQATSECSRIAMDACGFCEDENDSWYSCVEQVMYDDDVEDIFVPECEGIEDDTVWDDIALLCGFYEQ